MECNTCLHQSSTHCVCATLVSSSVVITCFGVLAVLSIVHHVIVLHTHHFWTVDVVEWHLLGFTQSTCHPLHQSLHLVVGTKVLANDGFHFKVVWQLTSAHTHKSYSSITIIRVPSNTSHHTPHGSMNQQCIFDTCHTPYHNHIHLFATTNTASVVMMCVLGLDKVEWKAQEVKAGRHTWWMLWL